MSGKIKIGGLVLAAALVVLGAWFVFGQGAPGDPCGGHYAGYGLRATFLSEYWDYELDPVDPKNPETILWQSNIKNGNATYYQYLVPGGDCIFFYRNGHVIVGISWPVEWTKISHERYVNMLFDYKGPGECGGSPAPSMNGVVQTEAIQFWTYKGFTGTRQSNGELLLTSMNALLNFDALIPETTSYCDITIKFRLKGDSEGYVMSDRFKVYYGPFDEGGFGWEISPIHEAYDVQEVIKVGKKLVPYGDPVPNQNSVNEGVASITSGSCYGIFSFPFKLRLERLQ